MKNILKLFICLFGLTIGTVLAAPPSVTLYNEATTSPDFIYITFNNNPKYSISNNQSVKLSAQDIASMGQRYGNAYAIYVGCSYMGIQAGMLTMIYDLTSGLKFMNGSCLWLDGTVVIPEWDGIPSDPVYFVQNVTRRIDSH